tara:strand:+ start:327 stop:1013 length:687 start_codon:yes stop_codon:yes gene_type:complete
LKNEKQTEQLDLSLAPEYLALAEKQGIFTGERLKERKPEVYRACVSLLAQGASYLSIAKLLSVSVNTIAAVKKHEAISIESEKRELAGAMRLATGLAVERINELLQDDERAKEIPLNQLAITTGILTEKTELLTGGATSRVDWVQPSASVDDYTTYLEELKRKAESIDITEDHEDNGFLPKETKTKGLVESVAHEVKTDEPKSAQPGKMPGADPVGDAESPDNYAKEQ